MVERNLASVASEIVQLETRLENTRKHYLTEREIVRSKYQTARDEFLAKAAEEYDSKFENQYKENLATLRSSYNCIQEKLKKRLHIYQSQLSTNVVSQILHPENQIKPDDE